MLINKLYVFLTLCVIAISGNPAMGILGKEMIYIGTLMIFMLLWSFKPLKLTRQDVLVLALFAFLTLTHILIFGFMVVVASLGFMIKMGIALLAVRLIPEFPRRYVAVMSVLSIISFVFFIPTFIGVDMQGIMAPVRLPLPSILDNFHVGIHNLMDEYDGSIRNMGMFWEPGAFAGYLTLALFFQIRDDQPILSRQGVVLALALLSTQSTTGYLTFFALALFYVYKSGWHNRSAMKLMAMPLLVAVLVLGAYGTFIGFSFLGEKLNAQFESAVIGDDASRLNRIGNLIYDLSWISNRPILGWSATPETRFPIDPDLAELITGQGNGLTGFVIRFGLVGLSVFLGSLAYNTKRISGSLSASLFSIIIVCMLLMGEQFMNYPLFLSLMFMPNETSLPPRISPLASDPEPSPAGRRTE